MAEGWCYYAWAVENDGWLSFSGVRRDGDGYIGQEVKKRMLLVQEVKKRMSDDHLAQEARKRMLSRAK